MWKVIGIDASYSMDHGEFSRFEKAIDKATAILQTAGRGEPVSLIDVNLHILISGGCFEIESRKAIAEEAAEQE